MQRHLALVEHIIEGRPTATGVVFRVRTEQLLAAYHANVGSLLVEFVVLSSEGSLGAGLLRHVVLQRAQFGEQFGLVLHAHGVVFAFGTGRLLAIAALSIEPEINQIFTIFNKLN